MIQLTPHMRILICHQAVDFRKGIDGLMRICREHLQRDPFTGTLFVFRNRPKTGIKILVYDGQGFWLCHKRFSKGRLKVWPTDQIGRSEEVVPFDLQVLLAGGDSSGLSLCEDWRKITLTQDLEPCVPPNPLKISEYGNDFKISRSHRHKSGCQLHSKSDKKVPGLQ